ncbi:pheromone processing endoprotease [Ceratobasidium sp. 395]|nr:pheromone processing endoprotease [Ceratobasidium sp. 395]
MSMFGSVIDPSKVELWTVPGNLVDPTTAPATPITTTSTTMSATATKQHPKPIEHLPGDHDTAEGEAHKPSFSTTNPATGNNSTSTAPVQPAPDEGYFLYMTDLLKSQTWLFAALGVVVIFVISARVRPYRRRRSRTRDHAALGGDGVPMSQVGAAAGGTRELYDAFGELSDGESEADEEAALRGRERGREGLQYHDGFLHDEEDERDKSREERYVGDVPEALGRRAGGMRRRRLLGRVRG